MKFIFETRSKYIIYLDYGQKADDTMRKAILLLTTFFFVIGLSGCYLLEDPDEVIQRTEEYCRENPDAQICTGSNVEDLDNAAIINVFNTMLAQHNDEDQDDFCETYISITNLNLLDQCRNNRTNLFFPEGIGEFSVMDVIQNVGADVIYTIKASNENNDHYHFDVSFTDLDGVIYIESWQYELVQEDHSNMEITVDHVDDHFSMFIADYLDTTITSNDFCEKYSYFADEFEADCSEERDYGLTVMEAIVIESITKNENIYLIEVTSYYIDDDPETSTITVEYTRNPDGTLKFDIKDSFDDVYDQYFQLVDEFFQDINASSYGPEVCDYYFVDFELEGCIYLANLKNDQGVKYALSSFTFSEEGYLAEVEFLTNDTSYFVNIKVFFFTDEYENVRMSMNILDDNYITQDQRDIVYAYIDSFNDSNLSELDFCLQFSTTDYLDDCITERAEIRSKDYMAMYRDLYYSPYGEIILEINFVSTEDSVMRFYVVDYHEIEGELRISLSPYVVGDYVTFDMISAYTENFVNTFNDFSIPTGDLLYWFVDPLTQPVIKELREYSLNNEERIASYNVYLGETNKYYMTLSFQYRASVTFEIIMIDPPEIAQLFEISNDNVSIDDVSQLLSDFIFAINFGSDVEEICTTFVVPEQYGDCKAMITEIEEDVIVEGFKIETIQDYYQISLRYFKNGAIVDTVTFDINVYSYVDYYQFSFRNNMDDITMSDKDSILWMFVTEFNDFEYTVDNTACAFFDDASFDECTIRREELSNQKTKMNPYHFDFINYPNYVDFAVYTEDGTEILYIVSYELEFFRNQIGETKMKINRVQEYEFYMTNDEATTIIEDIFNQFNNHGITDEEFCTTYSFIDDCYQFRKELREYNETLSVTEIQHNFDHRIYHVRTTVLNDLGVVTEIWWNISIARDYTTSELLIEGTQQNKYIR